MLDTKREREHERTTREVDRQITSLEDQLERARDRVGELAGDPRITEPTLEQGEIAVLRSGHDGRTAFWLGAPKLLRMRRRFEGRLPDDCFDRMLEHIRDRTHDSGVVEQTPDALVFSSSGAGRHPVQPHLMIRIVISNASSASGESEWYTTLTVTDRLEALAGRLFGTFGGIVGTGGLAAPFAASLAFPPLAPVFVVGWLGGSTERPDTCIASRRTRAEGSCNTSSLSWSTSWSDSSSEGRREATRTRAPDGQARRASTPRGARGRYRGRRKGHHCDRERT
jgi:hypothetical protein